MLDGCGPAVVVEPLAEGGAGSVCWMTRLGNGALAGGSGLPSGTVTLLFSDIEGSTSMLQRLRGRYATLLADHHRLVDQAVREANGQIVSTEGDGVFAVFVRA